jgi:hypothetical protein
MTTVKAGSVSSWGREDGAMEPPSVYVQYWARSPVLVR